MYGAAGGSSVFGPFTNKGPWGSGEFWSGTVDGDTIVIEFYKRTDENGRGFEIFEISHILAELDWRLRSNEPDVCFAKLTRHATASARTMPLQEFYLTIMARASARALC